MLPIRGICCLVSRAGCPCQLAEPAVALRGGAELGWVLGEQQLRGDGAVDGEDAAEPRVPVDANDEDPLRSVMGCIACHASCGVRHHQKDKDEHNRDIHHMAPCVSINNVEFI